MDWIFFIFFYKKSVSNIIYKYTFFIYHSHLMSPLFLGKEFPGSLLFTLRIHELLFMILKGSQCCHLLNCILNWILWFQNIATKKLTTLSIYLRKLMSQKTLKILEDVGVFQIFNIDKLNLSFDRLKMFSFFWTAECNVTDYTPWSPCSVTCGKGIRMRTRSYLMPQKAQMLGCDRQLVSKEMCVADQLSCS